MTPVDARACARCGAVLSVPSGKTPTVTFVGSGGQPNERVLVVDGREIHRCGSEAPVVSAVPDGARLQDR